MKDTYYITVRPLSRLSRLFWRLRTRLSPPETAWLNLGSGDKYVTGFINIDGNIFKKKDMWLDIRHGLPFATGSVDAIYSCHVFEHFYINELREIMSDCFRVLRLSGGMRILVPSLELAIHAYVQRDENWFPDFPSPFSSIGGKFCNFVFCDGQHRSTFDLSFMAELLEGIGFKRVVVSQPGKSEIFAADVLMRLEDVNQGHVRTSLSVEAYKE